MVPPYLPYTKTCFVQSHSFPCNVGIRTVLGSLRGGLQMILHRTLTPPVSRASFSDMSYQLTLLFNVFLMFYNRTNLFIGCILPHFRQKVKQFNSYRNTFCTSFRFRKEFFSIFFSLFYVILRHLQSFENSVVSRKIDTFHHLT